MDVIESDLMGWRLQFEVLSKFKTKNENKDTFDVHTRLKDAAKNGDRMNEMMCAENSSSYEKKLWFLDFGVDFGLLWCLTLSFFFGLSWWSHPWNQEIECHHAHYTLSCIEF